MTDEIKAFLNAKLDRIRAEFQVVDISPRQFARFGGDTEYAEWEVIAGMDVEGVPWDGWTDYDEITSHPLFKKTILWQAAYNTVA